MSDMPALPRRYCRDNPNLFKNADTAYTLAYAVILLNTDAHNPMVTKKITKSDFVRMNSSSDVDEHAAPVEHRPWPVDTQTLIANIIVAVDDPRSRIVSRWTWSQKV